MEIRKTTNYSPAFGVKVIITDCNVDKFEDNAYRFAKKIYMNTLDKLDTVKNPTPILVRTEQMDGINYLVAKNTSTGCKEYIEAGDIRKVEGQYKYSYVHLLRRLLDTGRDSIKMFWGIK